MVSESKLNKIFLSASIPLQNRHPQFYDTADVIAIRDAVRALATVVIPESHLIWGGHPSITPIIRYVLERFNVDIKQHVTLYQSQYYRDVFPDDNKYFENLIITPSTGEPNSSLYIMREQMLNKDFKAGIFIGGMEGIIDEYKMFVEFNPEAIIIPVASTGAAAKIIYKDFDFEQNKRLENDYAYMSLFNDLLKDII